MFETSVQWLVLGVDVSLKAALLAILAAAVLKVLRVRDCNVRHRVWSGVLAGMLLLPALTHVVPALQLPFTLDSEWFAAIQPAPPQPEPVPVSVAEPLPKSATATTSDAEQLTGPEQLAATESRGADGAPFPGMPGWENRSRSMYAGAPQGALQGSTAALAANGVDERERAGASAPLAAQQTSDSPQTPLPIALLLANLPMLVGTIWLLGASLMTARLLLGLWFANRLTRESSPIDPSELPPLARGGRGGREQSELCDASTSASQTPVPVLECPVIRSPLTVGSIRPQILLPLDWVEWPAEKLAAVLTHERTHVDRADCAFALVAEFNRCLYWFHPLAWWLRSQLSSLAEEACDDAAIDSTGDRATYARHLLEVAATVSQQGRVLATGVSMARLTHVEARINSILDFRRPLSRRLTWATTLVLLAAILPFIGLAAALRLSDGKPDADTDEVVASDNIAADNDSPESEQDTSARPPPAPPC